MVPNISMVRPIVTPNVFSPNQTNFKLWVIPKVSYTFRLFSPLTYIYGNGLSSFHGRDTKLDRFLAKNQYPQWKFDDIMARRQKLGIILENKESQKLKLFYKKCAPKLIF